MKRRGISLIVLVITIIVIVILGTAVIVTFAKNNPIEAAKVALLKGDVKAFSEELTLTFADEKLKDKNFDPEIINAASVEDMKKYIPSFSEKYYGKLCIVNGKLAYVKGNVTEKEKTSLEEVGLVPGSYITEGQINDIDNKTANIPEGATTTDISEYIDGVPAEQAEKFTIYKGKLYYRYEKTTYEERLSLHAAKIPFLPGDANEDGMLTDEDAQIIRELDQWEDREYKNNVAYVCDVNNDGALNITDHGVIVADIANIEDLIIDLEKQDPERIRFIGDYLKFSIITNFVNPDIIIDENVNACGYNELVKYYPDITRGQARKFAIIKGNLVYRYERLTENERAWIYEYEYLFNLGDVNFDGSIDLNDVYIIKDIVGGVTKRTPVLEVLANIDGSLRTTDKYPLIATSDTSRLKAYVEGRLASDGKIVTYYDLVMTHIRKIKSYS